MRYAVLNKKGKVINIIELNNINDLSISNKLVKAESVGAGPKVFYDEKTKKFYEKETNEIIKEFNSSIPEIVCQLILHLNRNKTPIELLEWCDEYFNIKQLKEEE